MEIYSDNSNLSIISGDLPELKTAPVPEFNPHIDDSDLAKNKLSELKQMRDRKFNKMKNMDLDWYKETDPETKKEIKTKLKPLPGNFNTVLADPELCDYEIAFDSFLGKTVIRDAKKGNSPWIVVDKKKIQAIRDVLSKDCKFTGVPTNEIEMAVGFVADNNRIDTMQEYMDALIPCHDGTNRLDKFFETYFTVRDPFTDMMRDPYKGRLSKYTFALQWARAYNTEPIKADISPVFIGKQGIRKSSLVLNLAFDRKFWIDIDFRSDNKELAKRLRGHTVIEVPEIAGLNKKATGELKAFLASETDTTRIFHTDDQFTYVRRCLIYMTTNETDFLDDPTGNRRYAPIEVLRFDEGMLKRDLLQLYAEGRVIFERDGGKKLHEDVEEITQELNKFYMKQDPWREEILKFADTVGGFLPTSVIFATLKLDDKYRNSPAVAKRISNILTPEGWRNTQHGKNRERGWIRC